jgi:hypothetical protein
MGSLPPYGSKFKKKIQKGESKSKKVKNILEKVVRP